MQEYAKNEKLRSQPQRKLIPSFELTKGRSNTPLLIFNLELGFVCTNFYGFVEYNPVKYHSNFVEPAVVARRQKDKIPHSGVVAETMKFLASSC